MECNVYELITAGKIISKIKIKKIVFFVLKNLQQRQGTVSVILVSAKEIQRLNKKYRGKNKVTDVLSFGFANNEIKINELGDIFICPSQIVSQAKIYQVTSQEEMVRMLVHGVLHLLGYDHQQKKAKEKMFKIQEIMVKKLVKKLL